MVEDQESYAPTVFKLPRTDKTDKTNDFKVDKTSFVKLQ